MKLEKGDVVKKLRVVLAGLISLASLLVPVASAQAAPCYGASCAGRSAADTGCDKDWRQIRAWRAWGVDGEVAAYVEVLHSDLCGSGWLMVATPFRQYNGTKTFIWNPGGVAQQVAPNQGSGFVPSLMVNDQPGVETCVGTEVYRHGAKHSWQFHGCYT